MDSICIPIPLPPGKAVELEVTVNGQTRWMHYRVEQLAWAPDKAPETHVDQIRAYIRAYPEAWHLVQIGAPGPEGVAITFRRQKTDS